MSTMRLTDYRQYNDLRLDEITTRPLYRHAKGQEGKHLWTAWARFEDKVGKWLPVGAGASYEQAALSAEEHGHDRYDLIFRRFGFPIRESFLGPIECSWADDGPYQEED